MKYSEIETYWNKNMCSGGCEDKFPFHFFKNRKILEIGCGSGKDALSFINNGLIYTGIDLTDKAVLSTKITIGNKGTVFKMNAEFLDFPDNYFDLVYSFGVIHHTISPKNVINEAYRVLKDGGVIFIMLYNKLSFRYIMDIMFIRKIFWFLHYPKYNAIRKQIPHPTEEQWISLNTDNLGCPLSKVYSKKEAVNLLNIFKFVKTKTYNYGWFRILTGLKDENI